MLSLIKATDDPVAFYYSKSGNYRFINPLLKKCYK